jgi:hypothetical protein
MGSASPKTLRAAAWLSTKTRRPGDSCSSKRRPRSRGIPSAEKNPASAERHSAVIGFAEASAASGPFMCEPGPSGIAIDAPAAATPGAFTQA